jgi:hypothetical protein
MDRDNQQSKGRELTDDERRDMRTGFALEEMDKINPGWQIVKKMLEERAYHTWADPRETTSEKEWVFRELNSFWSATNAKELLTEIEQLISRAHYLDKVSKGEIEQKPMKI